MPDFLAIFSPWTLALVAAVSIQATVLAYLHHPKAKAFLLALPVPSTLAMLALGQPVDATNVLALGLLLLYTHGVRCLHYGAGVAIVPAIVLSAVMYCAAAGAAARAVPAGDATFWISEAAVLAISFAAFRAFPHRLEPGHRTSLPVWIKLPIIAAVILALVAARSALRGFITMFPMVGVVAAYETRRSLWTTCRQIPVFAIAMVIMLAEVRLTQARIGLPLALAAGWVVFLGVLFPLNRWAFGEAGMAAEPSP